MKIQSFIQAYVQAIASILEAEVTVVDEKLIRVGGSGDYRDQVGQKIPHSSFFHEILTTGRPGIIRNVKEAFSCNECELFGVCKELANLAYPIYLGERVVGVIGLIAFSEEERRRLTGDQPKLEEFLKYMSVLIESKIMTLEHSHKLESRLQVALEDRPELEFIGRSPKILEILDLARRVGPSDSTVLISGESGTGKEVLAKYLHAHSHRRDNLMISINCAGIPDTLVESELFGYEEGAFTGARKGGHIGKFELAHGGTVFLDEVGEMPPQTQTKLLRVLQERVIERVGGKAQIPVDVRIICATNRNLEEMVAGHRFREDLYYRLNVIPITLPPLRERREDIPLLIRHFIAQCNAQLHKAVRGIEEAAEQVLVACDWPGNIRELRNMIEYLENVAQGDTIRLADLPASLLQHAAGENRTLAEMLRDYERLLLGKLCGSLHTAADKDRLAKQLGVSRATLYRKLSAHGLLDDSSQS